MTDINSSSVHSDRQMVADLVTATVQAVMRRHPQAEFKPGTVIVNSTSSVKGIAVKLDDGVSVVYPDNVTGQPLVLNERVIVMLAASVALIVGRWQIPHVPHWAATGPVIHSDQQTINATPYANYPHLPSLSFTKYRNDSAIIMDLTVNNMYLSGFAGNRPGNIDYAIRANSIDQYIMTASVTPMETRYSLSGMSGFSAASLPAGTYTFQARWKAFDIGFGLPIGVVDTLSVSSMRVAEVSDK